MFLEKNYLMIGNTRWHWATKIQEDWKYFHTTPNPIKFKDKNYSELSWASVGPIPVSYTHLTLPTILLV